MSDDLRDKIAATVDQYVGIERHAERLTEALLPLVREAQAEAWEHAADYIDERSANECPDNMTSGESPCGNCPGHSEAADWPRSERHRRYEVQP